MAFAVTAYQAYPIYLDSPVNLVAHQHYVLTITGTSADVALDFSADGGTFWTAAGGSTAGAAALSALDAVKLVADHRVSSYLQGVTDGKILTYTAATPGSNEYTTTSATVVPDYAIHAGEGLTAYTWHLVVALSSGSQPVLAGF